MKYLAVDHLVSPAGKMDLPGRWPRIRAVSITSRRGLRVDTHDPGADRFHPPAGLSGPVRPAACGKTLAAGIPKMAGENKERRSRGPGREGARGKGPGPAGAVPRT